MWFYRNFFGNQTRKIDWKKKIKEYKLTRLPFKDFLQILEIKLNKSTHFFMKESKIYKLDFQIKIKLYVM